MSGSKYGVLEAWRLEQAGAEIPAKYWLDEDAAWEKGQSGDGGWKYQGAATTKPGVRSVLDFYNDDYEKINRAAPQTRPTTAPVPH